LSSNGEIPVSDFNLRTWARGQGVVAIVGGQDGLLEFEEAVAAFRQSGDRRALASAMLALGVGRDDVERIAAGENVIAVAA
jgi:hypothetical protein